tara:strand:- start:201 stop:662 length:462 start_codon:yes stop_codon:yes gene_type:complete
MTPQQIELAQAKEAIIMAPEIRQKLHDAQKYAAGLELNLAAVIQRAEAAEKALAEAQSRLLHTQAGLTIWMERSKANARELDEAYDAMCDIAQKLDCAEDWVSIKAALKETLGKVGQLQAAVADAPHDMWCAVTFPAAPADLMSCNCWKSETK